MRIPARGPFRRRISRSLLAGAALSALALTAGLAAGTAHATPAKAMKPASKHAAARQAGAAFDRLVAEFLPGYFALNPEHAVDVGDFSYAKVVVIPDDAARQRQRAFAERWLQRLDRIDAKRLTPHQRVDLAILRTEMAAMRWRLDELRSHEWNPSEFNIAGPLARITSTTRLSPEERLSAMLPQLEAAPAYYAAAAASLRKPTREHTELAVLQSDGTLRALDDVAQLAREAKLGAEAQARLTQALANARKAVDGYAVALKERLASATPENTRSFRLGAALYEPKFRFETQSAYTAQGLYQRALAEKERLHARMDELADQLWPKVFGDAPKPADRIEKIGRMIGKLSERHVSREGFYDEIKRQIGDLTAWVNRHQLVDLDPKKPLEVRPTPHYLRGVTMASVQTPGPFDPSGATYYNVTPLDDFTPEQAESYLREYNHWVLQILNIHEAIPGHYAQLIYAQRAPSPIKSVFSSNPMVEGWAVYSERMMLESGWGNHEPEMWLMYAKWNLRVVCNTLLDYGVHVLGWNEQQALDLLRREAFQSEVEAAEKWRRAQLTSVQLTGYFAGFAEIYDYREATRKQLGPKFSLRAFHDRLLSYGNAPVHLIKAAIAETDSKPTAAGAVAKAGHRKGGRQAPQSAAKP